MLLPARIGETSGLSAQFHEHPDPYPPIGFCSFADHELGNGDTFGLYWPFGREAREPIICEIWHDEGALVPMFSSLSAFLDVAARSGERPVIPDLLVDPASPSRYSSRLGLQMRREKPKTHDCCCSRPLELFPNTLTHRSCWPPSADAWDRTRWRCGQPCRRSSRHPVSVGDPCNRFAGFSRSPRPQKIWSAIPSGGHVNGCASRSVEHKQMTPTLRWRQQ